MPFAYPPPPGKLGKAFWQLNFWAFQALRVPRLRRVPLFDRWYLANMTIQFAPELYDSLHYHRSWTALWLKFLFDPSLSLYSRMTRSGGSGGDPVQAEEISKAA